MFGLLDLIFSNLWIILILFFVFRSLTRGVGREIVKRAEPVPGQQPPIPEYFPWDVDEELSGPKEPERNPALEHLDQPRTIKPSSPERREKDLSLPKRRKADHSMEPIRQTGSTAFSGPIQGMIWSQIYGRPRSLELLQRKTLRQGFKRYRG